MPVGESALGWHYRPGLSMSTAEPAPLGRVVVLDDDQDSREPFAMFLRMNGFAVDEFATGEETLEAVARAVPSLIVMDIALGGPMDGYEVARRLRASAASRLDAARRAHRLLALLGEGRGRSLRRRVDEAGRRGRSGARRKVARADSVARGHAPIARELGDGGANETASRGVGVPLPAAPHVKIA